MSAMDEVAALPGGAELAALADKIETAQPQAVRDIANRWKQAAGKCGDQTNVLQRSVTQLDGAWEGKSADGFVAYMANVTKCGTSMADALNGAATDLEAAANALETAKTSMSRICENLLSRARQTRQQLHGQPQEDVDSVIRSYCAEAMSDAQPVVSQAESAVNAAMRHPEGPPRRADPEVLVTGRPERPVLHTRTGQARRVGPGRTARRLDQGVVHIGPAAHVHLDARGFRPRWWGWWRRFRRWRRRWRWR